MKFNQATLLAIAAGFIAGWSLGQREANLRCAYQLEKLKSYC